MSIKGLPKPNFLQASQTQRHLFGLLIFGLLMFFGVYIWIACSRMFYPYDLEWMEGATLLHVAKIIDGESVYQAPGISFTPFLYTPGFYYLGCIGVKIFGLYPAALRIISFGSSLCCMGLLFGFAKRETGMHSVAWLAPGFFVATYGQLAGWFDLARVDSTALAFCLGALYLLRFKPTPAGLIAAAALAFCAVFTKQTMLGILAPTGLACCWFLRARRGWLFLVTWMVLVGIGFWYFNSQSDGWFAYYTYFMPKGHRWASDQILGFWHRDLLLAVPIFLVLGCLWLLVPGLRFKRVPVWFYASTWFGFFCSAYLSRLHSGGFVNVLMPLYAWLALLATLGLFGFLHGSWDSVERPVFLPMLKAKTPSSPTASLKRCGWLLLVIVQCLMLAYWPQNHLPNDSDYDAGSAVVEQLKTTEGRVWVPYHGMLATYAGKEEYAHLMALADILRSKDDGQKQRLEKAIKQAFGSNHFQLIFLDYLWFENDLRHYQQENFNYLNPIAFFPKSGMKVRPTILFTLPENLEIKTDQ